MLHCFSFIIQMFRHFCLLMIMSSYLQPPRGYMEEVVGLVATLEGMVLCREAQLSVAGIQVPFSFLAFIILLMTC